MMHKPRSFLLDGSRQCFTWSLLIVVVLLCLEARAQDRQMKSGASHEIEQLIERGVNYSTTHPVEKVYIHFDRASYSMGEVCWFKAYVVSALDLEPTPLSGVLYVDWFNPRGQLVHHQKLKVLNGEAFGDQMFLPDSPSGIYTIQAYTNWMKNAGPDFFFKRQIVVRGADFIQPREKAGGLDVQFFPEGGVAVDNILSTFAFKAIDVHGKGVDIAGFIVDEKNRFVSSFKSTHRGMGVFPHRPMPDQSYKVVLNNGEVFEIPRGEKSGYVMNVSNMNPDNIIVQIQASESFLNTEFFLVAQAKGIIRHAGKFLFTGSKNRILIPKRDLPSGPVQITLLDSHALPRSERMVFIDQGERLRVQVTGDKQVYASRDSVRIELKVTDNRGSAVATTMSVSITDADRVPRNSAEGNILTHMLFESDLRGVIEDPQWYFRSKDPEHLFATDLVMLTHGWRKFNWNEIRRDSVQPPKFLSEQGLSLSGRVIRNSTNKPLSEANVLLILDGYGYQGVHSTNSDEAGRFMIDHVDFSDSTLLLWQIRNEKGRPHDATVSLLSDTSTIPPIDTVRHTQARRLATTGLSVEAKGSGRAQETNLDKITILREVEIEGESIRKVSHVGFQTVMIRPDEADRRLATAQFVSRYAIFLPFLRSRDLDNGTTMWFTTRGVPVNLFIDGVQIEGFGPSSNPYMAMNSLLTGEIESVLVSEPFNKPIVISIKTNDGLMGGTPGTGIVKLFANGYQVPRQFYQPRYGPSDPSPEQPDQRNTLYWNPSVTTDSAGVAVIKYYNSDLAKRFHVTVEGIKHGLIGTVSTILGAREE